LNLEDKITRCRLLSIASNKRINWQQRFANEWATHFVSYNAADIPADFQAALDASDQYQASRKTSNKMTSREAFAKAYMGYRNKQETAKSD
jgi:hypothetical protein